MGIVLGVVVAVIVVIAYRQFSHIKGMDARIHDLEREIEEQERNPRFQTRCPRCKKTLDIPESDRAKIKFKCPRCKSIVSVRNPRTMDDALRPRVGRRRKRSEK